MSVGQAAMRKINVFSAGKSSPSTELWWLTGHECRASAVNSLKPSCSGLFESYWFPSTSSLSTSKLFFISTLLNCLGYWRQSWCLEFPLDVYGVRTWYSERAYTTHCQQLWIAVLSPATRYTSSTPTNGTPKTHNFSSPVSDDTGFQVLNSKN